MDCQKAELQTWYWDRGRPLLSAKFHEGGRNRVDGVAVTDDFCQQTVTLYITHGRQLSACGVKSCRSRVSSATGAVVRRHGDKRIILGSWPGLGASVFSSGPHPCKEPQGRPTYIVACPARTSDNHSCVKPRYKIYVLPLSTCRIMPV